MAPLRVRMPSILAPRIPCAVAIAVAACAAGTTRVHAESTPIPRYALTAWAAEKGLPPGDVFSITQDSEGYLWLGTPTGLLRFDGSRFAAWPPAESKSPLPSGPVHALVGSPDG